MKKTLISLGAACIVAGGFLLTGDLSGEENRTVMHHKHKKTNEMHKDLEENMSRFFYDSGYDFTYPEDGVRGLYVTGHSAGGSRFTDLLDLTDSTDLNSMVIDIKDDYGNLTFNPKGEADLPDIGKNMISDPSEMMNTLEEHDVYPIARIVVFKDSVLAEKRPDLSFKKNGSIWKNGSDEAFVNPYEKEVWDYNIKIAKEAAKMGFQEIQFDYVRFPEGFEHRDEELDYSRGDYGSEGNNVQQRVTAVTEFVEYAKEELQQEFDIDVSVDIFGYSATLEQAPGIGQNFSKISSNVDIISSMIYPSHWTPYFGIDKPDLHPYKLTDEYAQVENEVLNKLDNAPESRPWIQDFTASWLGSGNYLEYGVDEVEAQIEALNDNDIDEFLLWNATNNYTEGVDYTP
ncbi:GTP-binding protein [Salibacterium salarium]|uniref:GTP-binding protein n=1 Tax=Salibacterium salarium TaxID=284579 RepID=A0A428MYK9_9BACI|nr:putative glycoside hydrolase [Salibacterium salarium]RSL31227.1 GTP-binding protein [Salibacterium salarium]